MNRREFLVTAAGLPLALASAPAAASRRSGRPLALVTADTMDRVTAVEPASGRIYSHIATPEGPRSIERVGATAVVAHTSEGAVSLIDARTLRLRRSLRAFAEPRYTAASPDSRFAYVTDSARAELVLVELGRGRVVHRTELDGPARHISVDPAGRRLWISLGSKSERVAVIDVTDAARPFLVGHVRPPFLAHDVGFDPSGRRVWVTSGDRKTIAVYDARTRRILFRLAAGAPPQHVTLAGGLAYVTSGDDGTLRVHRLRDGRLLRTTAIPVGSYNVQQGFGRVVTPSLERGTLCVLSGRGAMLQQVQVAPSSHDACLVMSA